MTGKIVPTNFSVALTDLHWRGCLDSCVKGFPQVPHPASIDLLAVPVWWKFLNEDLQTPILIFRGNKHIKIRLDFIFFG